MQKKKTFLPLVGVLIGLCVILIILSSQGVFRSVPFINSLFAPLQRITLQSARTITSRSESAVEKENHELIKQLVAYQSLKEENQALQDQFRTSTVSPKQLLPAYIVGAPGFIPGVHAIEEIIIDKGTSDGIKEGMIVVYKDNLIGMVHDVTNHFSQVIMISNKGVSFSAKKLSGEARGVIKGQGGGDIVLDNVVLNQTIKPGDVMVTAGDTDIAGKGYPPDLVIGRITSVEKDPSALFQKADIEPLVDITKLEVVFILGIRN